VHNGIDTSQYQPDYELDVLRAYDIDPDRPTVVYVGRITRQKGLPYLLRAARQLPAEAQLVLLAGAPDTPEIAAEVKELVTALEAGRSGVVWIPKMVTKPEVIQILTHSTVFVCPSIYEPMGIVNLEAMACRTAVVATATGGIPEVVADGETGLLVPIEQDPVDGTPLDADAFVDGLAEAIGRVLTTPGLASRLGDAGRERAVREFSWAAIAARTLEIYSSARAAAGRTAGATQSAGGLHG
jgi:starch synthase